MNRPVEDNRLGTDAAAGFKLEDAYYAIFRHKGKVVACFLAGIAAAVYFWASRPPLYRSDARMLVRYVRDAKSIDASPTTAQVTSPDSRGDHILNTEIEILTSYDLAAQVADLVGPERILAKMGGGTNRVAAAVEITKGLLVDVPRQSNGIRVAFRHPDPDVAQAVLRQVVDSYLRKHAEVHRALGVVDDFLNKQTDELRTRLSQTEEELRKVKSKVGVFSVEEAKKAITEQLSKIQQELLAAEAELAQRRTSLEQLRRTAGVVSTNAAGPAAPATNVAASAVEVAPDAEKVKHYRAVGTRLESLRNRELDLLSQYGEENVLIREVRGRIAETEKLKQQLEAETPRLAESPRTSAVVPVAGEPAAPAYNFELMASNAKALEAKIEVLKAYMEKVRGDALALDASESQISQLERKKALEEANYRYFAASLEQARIDEALGSGKLPNISVIQEATPPFKDPKGTLKLMGMALAGGLGGGLALALLLEMFVDRSIRKPGQIRSQLRLPLFLTVPTLHLNGHDATAARHRSAGSGEAADGSGQEVASVNGHSELDLYYEALRDRVVMYFQVNGLTHRPKLVGVTSCSHGAGVSTFATGLAASMSETGDGNVLLVDMNQRNGAAVHPFYRGRAVCTLDEALEMDKRGPAQVLENLYVVTSYTGQGQKVGLLPKKFANIVPKLQATDYDYIIFDLPPVNQTSATSKLAGLLDVTVMVLESEKSQQDAADRALALLAESKARVAAVLNKHRTYVPRRLQAEF